jgi:hypothetical protein
MSTGDDFGGAARTLLDRDEVAGVLSGSFYAPLSGERPRAKTLRRRTAPPTTRSSASRCTRTTWRASTAWSTASRPAALTKANRSALIRHALSLVELDKVPRGM